MSEQRRFWRDCADAQARLNLRCSHRRLVPNSLDAVHLLPGASILRSVGSSTPLILVGFRDVDPQPVKKELGMICSNINLCKTTNWTSTNSCIKDFFFIKTRNLTAEEFAGL